MAEDKDREALSEAESLREKQRKFVNFRLSTQMLDAGMWFCAIAGGVLIFESFELGGGLLAAALLFAVVRLIKRSPFRREAASVELEIIRADIARALGSAADNAAANGLEPAGEGQISRLAELLAELTGAGGERSVSMPKGGDGGVMLDAERAGELIYELEIEKDGRGKS